MSRLVVDTNIILSSFLTSGPPRQVLNRIRDGKDQLCLSQPILREYLEVLARTEATRELMEVLLSLFEDPADNMFLECAAEAGADYIISGDRHLRRLGTFERIEILSPRAYLTRLKQDSPRA